MSPTPIPTRDTRPGTIVRSESYQSARGVFVGVTPAGCLWVAWRRPAKISDIVHEGGSLDDVFSAAEKMAVRLDGLWKKHAEWTRKRVEGKK